MTRHHPEYILVTPKNVPVRFSRNSLEFPALRLFEQVPFQHARTRVGESGCLWNPHMRDVWAKVRKLSFGHSIDIAEGYPLRIGLKNALFLNGKKTPVLVRHSCDHKTRPGMWMLPGGVLESARSAEDIQGAALAELVEEIVPCYGGDGTERKIGSWRFNSRVLSHPWESDLLEQQGCSGGRTVFALQRLQTGNQIAVRFGGDGAVMVEINFEPETGSVELTFPWSANLPEHVLLRDGELDTVSGTLLNRPIFDPRFAIY